MKSTILNIFSTLLLFFIAPSVFSTDILTNRKDLSVLGTTIADFNGDTFLDVVFVDRLRNEIYLVINLSDTGFAEPQIVGEMDKPTLVKPIDINNDRYTDLVVLNDDGGLEIFKNNGFGQLSSIKKFGALNPWGDLLVKDVNNDGFQDVISCSIDDNSVYVFKNLGNSTFSNPSFISNNSNGASGIDMYDIDGDGDLDLVVACFSSDQLKVFTNNGNFQFTLSTTISTMKLPNDCKFIDFNNDRKIDIVAVGYLGEIRQYINNGSSYTESVFATQQTNLGELYVNDYNKDGCQDIFHFIVDDGLVFRYTNENGTFSSPENISTSSDNAIQFDQAFDSKRQKFLSAISDLQNGQVWVLDFLDNRPQTTQPLINTTVTPQSPEYAYPLKSSKNSLKDIVFLSEGDIYLSKYLGRDLYLSAKEINSSISFNALNRGDFDKDGNDDLVLVSDATEKVYVSFYQNGFNTLKQIGDGDKACKIVVKDLDNDGDEDIVIGFQTDDKIVAYLNNGSKNFTTNVISNNTDGVFDFEVEDIDGDSDLDVISYSFTSELQIHYNNNMSFTNTSLDYLTFSPKFVSVMDLDNDGDLDVIYDSYESFNEVDVFVRRNNGGGSFTKIQIFDDIQSFDDVYAKKINNDQLNDLVFVDESSGILYESNNLGSISFSNPSIQKVLERNLGTIVQSDADSDGDIDLIYTSLSKHSIYVLKNDKINLVHKNIIACNDYTSPLGSVYTNSAEFRETVNNNIYDIVLEKVVIDTSLSRSAFKLTSNELTATSFDWLYLSSNKKIHSYLKTHQVDTNGTYAVEINKLGCKKTSAEVTVMNVSIEESNIQNIKVNVFPNPTSDHIKVESKDAIIYQLYNVKGEMVIQSINYEFNPLINLENQVKGIYFLYIESTIDSNKNARVKIIKN